MGKIDKISERQLSACVFVSLLSPMIRIVPDAVVILGGRAAWLSPLVAAAASVLYILFLRAMFKNRGNNEGMGEVAKKSLGRAGGGIFCVVIALWLTFYMGYVARTSAERLLTSVYAASSTFPFIVVIVGVSLIAARGFTDRLARTAEVFVPILVTILATVLLFSTPQIKTEFLLPVTYMDADDILLGALPVINISGAYFYFTFLLGKVEKRQNSGKGMALWAVGKMLIVMAITVCTIGALSAEIILEQQNSFFVVIRNITLFDLIERIEALVIGIWVITDFVYLAALLMIAAEAWKSATGVRNRNVFVWPTAVVAVVLGQLFASNAFSLKIWSEITVPVISSLLSFVIVPVVLLIGKLRKKI